jgi:hypothetical protein
MTSEDAKRWIGVPVCVVLKDGNYYVGWITGVKNEGMTLSGRKGHGKLTPSTIQHAENAQISGLFSGFSMPMAGGGWGGDSFGFNPMGGGLAPGGMPAGGMPAGGVPAANNAAAKNGGGMMGMLGKIVPGIKLGFGIMRTIMPLLGGLKI